MHYLYMYVDTTLLHAKAIDIHYVYMQRAIYVVFVVCCLSTRNLKGPHLVAQVVKVIRRQLGWVGPQQTTKQLSDRGKVAFDSFHFPMV